MASPERRISPNGERRYDVAGFIVWYADLTSHSSRDISWESMPEDSVVCVVLYFTKRDDYGRRYSEILQGYDWYFRVPPSGFDSAVYGYGSLDDTPDGIRARYPGAVVKRGKWVSTPRYAMIIESAVVPGDF